MSIIEKAAQRLEQLRKAGVEAPEAVDAAVAGMGAAAKTTERVGKEERHAHALPPIHLADPSVAAPAPSGAIPAVPARPVDPGRRSKSVEDRSRRVGRGRLHHA